MFKLRYFPNAWKTAVVIPILKPGKNPKLAESHRPISLLRILSKLAEKIISTRLNDYLEKENILVPEQHGFRPRLSTTHQLLRVVEYIKDGIDRHQYTAAVFLDIQKAFGRDRRFESDGTMHSENQPNAISKSGCRSLPRSRFAIGRLALFPKVKSEFE
ncbi:probable RNA-directed DNA polymerase from transposon X-element [Trichonephila clavipes]|nr:probable RNA-directed DNA polymerase from transposon X-element [Trichonephila clavipes]